MGKWEKHSEETKSAWIYRSSEVDSCSFEAKSSLYSACREGERGEKARH